ncbi:ERAP1-like C-terminal domain-containing protein [Fulvivirga sp. 29W222]|uniref:Aminopeptidase N n=1 Tax=Fulvivirga marina TaxID=2494733 RepID=A0A937KD24_9BACT|nr:M1 family aminopeptidase [Fulvivirga marina]MBL6445595.1 ERAP1-like C-terminal domain-containing protein [Fulvivirga marina]
MLSILVSCTKKGDNLLVPGISEELAQHRKSVVDDITYELHFDIPRTKDNAIHSTAKISFDLKNTRDDLILDFNADPERLKVIHVNDEAVDIRWEKEHIVIPANFLKKRNVVDIQFDAGEQSLNRHEDYLYTLFVPDRASTCFPLFDQPDLKARYKLSLTVPSEWKAVANGNVVSQKNVEAKTAYMFEETPLISSYLFSFVVGNFKKVAKNINGRVMNMYHRETDSVKLSSNIDAIFDWHEKSLKWMEDYTSVPLPFEKFDFILIPSFQYGGMEHPGAVLYNASALLLDESSTLKQELGRGRLIAHETAHMWFGDLVTMKWFNDVWLKEVFANLMASKIVNPGFPQINHDLQFLTAHYPSAYSVDRTMGTHPIQQTLDNLKDAGTLYGAIIYQKAPIVMRMLENSLGYEKFQNGLKQYLNSYAFGNATWDDLINILAKDASFDIERWNKHWVKSGGMPIVQYAIESWDNKNISEMKIWSTNDQMEMDDDLWWRQDLKVLMGYGDTSRYYNANLLTNKEEPEFSGEPYPEYLFTNGGGLGYGYFKMNKDSKDFLIRNVDSIKDPVVRASIWINLYEASLRGHIKPDKLIDRAIESLPKEEETLITEYITGVIHTIYWKMLTEESRISLAPKLEGILLNMMLHATSVNLKSTYFNALKSIAISENGVLVLKKIWNEEMELDGLPLSEKDFTSLAYELAIREIDGVESLLQEQGNRITNPDRKKRFNFILPALSEDEAVRDAFFESLKEAKNRENEAWVLEALAYLHHPLRSQSSVKYIKPSLEMLQEIQLTGDIFFPKRWLDNTLVGHSSEKAVDEVRQFLYRHNDYPANLKNKVLQSADLLFKSVEVKRKKK